MMTYWRHLRFTRLLERSWARRRLKLFIATKIAGVRRANVVSLISSLNGALSFSIRRCILGISPSIGEISFRRSVTFEVSSTCRRTTILLCEPPNGRKRFAMFRASFTTGANTPDPDLPVENRRLARRTSLRWLTPWKGADWRQRLLNTLRQIASASRLEIGQRYPLSFLQTRQSTPECVSSSYRRRPRTTT